MALAVSGMYPTPPGTTHDPAFIEGIFAAVEVCWMSTRPARIGSTMSRGRSRDMAGGSRSPISSRPWPSSFGGSMDGQQSVAWIIGATVR